MARREAAHPVVLVAENRSYYSLQAGEQDVASASIGGHKLFVTSQRLVEVKAQGWGNRETTVMGLESIDNVQIQNQSSRGWLVFGILFVVGGVFLIVSQSMAAGRQSMAGGFVLLGIGVFCLIIFGLTQKHTLRVFSGRTDVTITFPGSQMAVARQITTALEEAKQTRLGSLRFGGTVPPPPSYREATAPAGPVAGFAEREKPSENRPPYASD